VDVTTVALGGDTEIYCRDGRPMLGRRAVRPLCLAPDAPKRMGDRSFLFPLSGKTCGITPTDLFCAEGRSGFGDRGIAVKALTALADECGLPVRGLYETIEEAIRLRLLRAIASALAGKVLSEGGETDALLKENRTFRTILRLDVPVVGIGTPVRPFLDLLAGRVDGEVIVPQHHAVGNAMGAVCTGVHGRKEVTVRCEPRLVQGEEVLAYHVTTVTGQKVFAQRDEALAFAIEQAKAELSSYMEHSRARGYDVRIEVRDIAYLEWGIRKVAESVVSAVAEETFLPHPVARTERPIGGGGPV
jgi:N-methylhydantoinase A/oxoprolinase/acetone carboxylase beta subunit